MGALAPPPLSHWLPQDDFLLKNAVEHGASLESLAKGAVRFSQRFTFQELQDRWYSLLYDPVVSAEASVHMIELERSASTAKFHKETKSISGKRKAESVRKCYYAMRKRICSEPLDTINISFPGGPGTFGAGKGDEPLSADCFFGDEISDYLGIQEPNVGAMHHSFPELQSIGAGSSSDGVSSSAFETGFYDNEECVPLNICPSFDDDVPLTDDQNIVKEFDHSEELHSCDLFESMDLDIKSSPILDEINDKEGKDCSGFEIEVINTSPSDCGTSLHNFGSLSPQMSTWGAVESLTPSLADVLGETEDHAGNNLVNLDGFDANDSIRGCISMNSQYELTGEMPGVAMKDSVLNAEEYFAELSNSLLNFTPEDDLLLVDADGKDVISKSYLENLSSFLLDSPDKCDALDLGEPDVAAHESLSSSSTAAHPEQSGDQGQYHCDDQRLIWSSDAQKLSSALTVNPAFPELRNGVIFCALNSEDTEIPNNDDVFLPIRFPSMPISSMTPSTFEESYYPTLSFIKDFSNNQRSGDGALMEREQSNYSKLHVSSWMTGSSFQLQKDSSHQSYDCWVKLETLDNDSQHVAFSKVTTCEGPPAVNSVNSSIKNLVPGSKKELLTKIDQPNNLNHNPAVSKQDINGTSNMENHESLHAEVERCFLGKIVTGTITIPSTSDQAEISCESDDDDVDDDDDDDVPYSSDVEAMILDMDLSPYDQDVYYSPGVTRYQNEDAKRTIIRLEQAAHAYLQRELSAKGAFAVLYGRRSKHFIKKTEVLLGRATEDVKVDIDLGMEGHPNRISRRQATIKMDNIGSFHLRNHGKFSIYVNGREVLPRENVGLVSGCLIEVRGLPFIFETNRIHIKQHLDNSVNESHCNALVRG